MNANVRVGMDFRTTIISQKVPPMNCRMGCPEWSGNLIKPTWICKTCVQRPVKDAEVSEIQDGERRDFLGVSPGQRYPLNEVWGEKLRVMRIRRERIAMED